MYASWYFCIIHLSMVNFWFVYTRIKIRCLLKILFWEISTLRSAVCCLCATYTIIITIVSSLSSYSGCCSWTSTATAQRYHLDNVQFIIYCRTHGCGSNRNCVNVERFSAKLWTIMLSTIDLKLISASFIHFIFFMKYKQKIGHANNNVELLVPRQVQP